MLLFPVSHWGTPGGGGTGLLDLLDPSTHVIAAWSSARSLKSSTSANGAMIVRSNGAGAQTTIGFSGGVLNTSALSAACVGGSKEGVVTWLDQTGNANHLIPQSGASDNVICSTAGAITQGVTVTGGSVMPMIGFGAGNNASGTGVAPSMVTGSPNVLNAGTSAMPVSFGAVATHWMLCVVKPTSGSGDIHGEIGDFVHTGDANSFSNDTSAIHIQNNTSQTGAINGYAHGDKPIATVSNWGSLHMLGSVFDGTHGTLYIDGVAGTQVVSARTLGAGGQYAVGATAKSPSTDPWCGFIVEMLIGTTFGGSNLASLQANMKAFYGTP